MKNGQFEQLRILGRGKGTDIGAAIAIELQEDIYAPIHDHRGNICCLLDSDSGLPIEFYRYTAYGELTRHGTPTGNPWRFASKRWDPHTDLYNFCKRDYDSNLGRWLTCDPNGYADGPNLYAYTHNRPLILIDPWGLEGQSLYDRNRAETSSKRDGNYSTRNSHRDEGSSWNWDNASHAAKGMVHGACDFAYESGSSLCCLLCEMGCSDEMDCLERDCIRSYVEERNTAIKASVDSHICGILDIDPTNEIYQASRHYTAVGLTVASAASVAYGGIKFLSNINKLAMPAAAAAFQLNRLEVAHNNIRVLRGWTKSKGWKKLPNPQGAPEKWGVYKKGEFE